MVYGISKARWFRLYEISNEAYDSLRSRLSKELVEQISKEVSISDNTQNNGKAHKILFKGVDLFSTMTRSIYLKNYKKMSDSEISDLTTGIIKRANPQISKEELEKVRRNYLEEEISTASSFYSIFDNAKNIVRLIVPDNAVDRLIGKITENSGQTPYVYDLPDGPEFLLWVFSKYWNKEKVGKININNVSSVSNIEEQSNHEFTHKASGEAERNSLEICFKIMLNKAITSMRFDIDFNKEFGNTIELHIPQYKKSPKSFRFSLPLDSLMVPDGLNDEIDKMKEDESLVFRKGLGAFLFFQDLFPHLEKEYISEKEQWFKTKKKEFIRTIREHAITEIGS